MANVTLEGNPMNTIGDLPEIGSEAPDFELTDGQLADIKLSDFASLKRLLNIVPSLDTPTCATSTKKFNDFFRGRKDAVALIVSADLPFAQGRFCEAEDLNNVIMLSMMKSRQFAKDYGVLLTDGVLEGLTARAVVVIDEEGKVIYTQLVGEIADEPDYDAALAALA